MKRLLALLILSILGITFLAWLQVEFVSHGAAGNGFVAPLIWALGGACLTLLLVVINRMWTQTQALEEAVEARTRELALREQQLREDIAQRRLAESAYQQSTERAEALVRTAAHLNAYLDQKALLNAICEETAQVLEMPVVAISLYDAKQEAFTLAASVGLPPEITATAPALPLSWFREQVDGAREPYLVQDLTRVEQTPLAQLLVQVGFRTVIFVELVYRERLVGLLVASSLHQTREVDGADLQWMGGLADQAAQAITNTNLFRLLQRLVQRTQRQSQEMQRMMDTVPDGLLLLAQDYRLLMANPAGRRAISLLAPEHAQDEPLRILGGEEVEPLVQQCATQDSWRELRAGSEEAGGAELFELTARAMEGEGARGGGAWILVIRNITADHRRRQAAESQNRLATVGQLAAGIAHDFNNIMAVITLYSQSLERNPDFPKRREYLATISEQAQHASALISQILDFSRNEAMERGRLDLAPFVKEMVKLLKRTLPENITVTLQAEPGEYTVRADPALLQQALMNLALNARDAMPNGGDLLISLAAVDLKVGEGAPLRGLAPGRYMCLSVADSGEGIAPEVQRRLFEPFFSTREAAKGTGMGLTQVYGIVRQHGGEVEVDSSPGRGARFTLYLPALQPESILHEATSWRAASGGATVLLVEDHEPTREAIGDTLELLGYKVLVATTGREALELFDAQPEAVDLVLSDMVMPEMGGVALYRELMQRNPDLKMIVMTGYPLEHEGRSLLEQGIVDWIRKPFSPDMLAEKIEGLLE